MEDPRICIVGAGALSTKRIYPYIGAAGGRLVGVCDLDGTKAHRNATRWGGTVYSDMEIMLREQKPDGVMICVGPRHHARLAMEVLRLGFPVYTEKPPALNAAQALEVARVAEETGLLCTTAFKSATTSPTVALKRGWTGFPPRIGCPFPSTIARRPSRTIRPNALFSSIFAFTPLI